jgi:hypothetical protein
VQLQVSTNPKLIGARVEYTVTSPLP